MSRLITPHRRVVVTGLGLVTPLATGVQATWRRLLDGHSGIVSLRSENGPPSHIGSGFDELPSTVAAVVKHSQEGIKTNTFHAADCLERGDDRRMALFTQYALGAAKQALVDAKWMPTEEKERQRTGVCLGSGIGSLQDLQQNAETYAKMGYKKISPLFVPRILVNMAAGHLSMKYGFQGPNHAASTACTTGAHSIGDASRFIMFGDADVMVAGGSEASVTPLAMAGFARAKSLSTQFNNYPQKSSRPFDKDRDGFVIGEGAGVVVLEELEHALKRGANIYAEISGYGLSGDAHHMTAPPEDGAGAALAMRRAMEHGGLTAADIDYVNAHATSTPQGDIAESRAIASLFCDPKDANRLAVSSTKGAIGHLLGAAGAVEAIFTMLAVYDNAVPPTLNLATPDPVLAIPLSSHVPNISRRGVKIRHALSNSFGFGGTNACLCVSSFPVTSSK